MKKIWAASFLIAVSSLIAFGQTPGCAECLKDPREGERWGPPNDPWRLEDLQNLKKKPVGVRYFEARLVKKGPLAPSPQDLADHEAFLKQSNTGLIRLLPSQTGREKIVPGGGSYYSFHSLSHDYGRGSDLVLSRPVMRPLIVRYGDVPDEEFEGSLDLFMVAAGGPGYGMLTNLGEVPLDEITLNDQRARYLAEYEPPVSASKARCESRRFREGETIEGRLYKTSLPIQVGATYLVRSINYPVSDVLVAFRLARRDDFGSAIIAWKLLKDVRPRNLKNTGANNCN
jgi:hypothetical protein